MVPVSETTEHDVADSGEDVEPELAETPVYADLEFTLYLRPGASTVTKERQKRIRERFERLEEHAVLETLSVEQWSKEVTVTDDGKSADETAVQLYDECKTAVEAVGGRLQPFFEESQPVSGFLSRASNDRVLVFPVLGVTVRRDGELVGLFPCWIDGTHYSVGDCLDRLEAGEVVTNLE